MKKNKNLLNKQKKENEIILLLNKEKQIREKEGKQIFSKLNKLKKTQIHINDQLKLNITINDTMKYFFGEEYKKFFNEEYIDNPKVTKFNFSKSTNQSNDGIFKKK